MGHERVGHTLQPSALVNEAYLKLIDIRQVQWQEFLALQERQLELLEKQTALLAQIVKTDGSIIDETSN